MKSTSKLALVAGTVLTLGLAGSLVGAQTDNWVPAAGWGHGMGPGWHMGPGAGMGPGDARGTGYPMGPGHGMGWGRGMGPGHGMGPGYGMGRGHGMGSGGMFFGPAGSLSERMESLKSELGVTAEQAGAWQKYADSVKTQVDSHQAWFDKMHRSPSARSAPEWFAERDAAMAQRHAGMISVTAALKELYGVLTSEQRAILDERLAAPGSRYARRTR